MQERVSGAPRSHPAALVPIEFAGGGLYTEPNLRARHRR